MRNRIGLPAGGLIQALADELNKRCRSVEDLSVTSRTHKAGQAGRLHCGEAAVQTAQVVRTSKVVPICGAGQLAPPRGLSEDSLEELAFETTYPAEALLFTEGQRPQGIIVVMRGQVKLSTTSADGMTMVVRIAKEGETLGLSATVLGQPHELTAQTMEPCRTKLIPREPFLAWLRANPEAALHVAHRLADEYNSTCKQMSSRLLSHNIGQRLARLLLELGSRNGNGAEEAAAKYLAMTHQEMAEMIGCSRETVTRMLALFRRKHVIGRKGSTLVILNQAALLTMGQGATL